jgi:hypothetical protein
MSETREAVRQRYASLAERLAVVDEASCCGPDGADACACNGYSSADLESVGLGAG